MRCCASIPYTNDSERICEANISAAIRSAGALHSFCLLQLKMRRVDRQGKIHRGDSWKDKFTRGSSFKTSNEFVSTRSWGKASTVLPMRNAPTIVERIRAGFTPRVTPNLQTFRWR